MKKTCHESIVQSNIFSSARLTYSGHVVGGRKLRKDVFQADRFDHEKSSAPSLGFV